MGGWLLIWKGYWRKQLLPNRGTISAFVWRDWRNHDKPVSLLRIEPNTSWIRAYSIPVQSGRSALHCRGTHCLSALGSESKPNKPTVQSSETLTNCQTTWDRIPHDSTQHCYCHENCKPKGMVYLFIIKIQTFWIYLLTWCWILYRYSHLASPLWAWSNRKWHCGEWPTGKWPLHRWGIWQGERSWFWPYEQLC